MTDRKKLGVAYWATVVVLAMLVGYPLSIGPATWMESRGVRQHLPKGVDDAITAFYMPIRHVNENGPSPVREAFRWYAGLWR